MDRLFGAPGREAPPADVLKRPGTTRPTALGTTVRGLIASGTMGI
jgi:hypothetical protein